MKQFLYLDTDIISSIIAQTEQGVITQMSVENSKVDEQTTERRKAIDAYVSGKGKFFKLLETEAKVGGEFEKTGTQAFQSSTKEVIEKVLHDASFGIAYEHISPHVVEYGNMEFCEEGNYLELNRVFDCIDFDYLEGLFDKNSVFDMIKESERQRFEEAAAGVASGFSREQRRGGAEKALKTEVGKKLNEKNKQFDDAAMAVRALKKLIPYKRALISNDGYLIPLDDKYFRIDPSHLGFRYGGQMTCVGMATNIIGKDTGSFNDKNPIAQIQYMANESLRAFLPTAEDNLCVIHPIALYYGR